MCGPDSPSYDHLAARSTGEALWSIETNVQLEGMVRTPAHADGVVYYGTLLFDGPCNNASAWAHNANPGCGDVFGWEASVNQLTSAAEPMADLPSITTPTGIFRAWVGTGLTVSDDGGTDYLFTSGASAYVPGGGTVHDPHVVAGGSQVGITEGACQPVRLTPGSLACQSTTSTRQPICGWRSTKKPTRRPPRRRRSAG